MAQLCPSPSPSGPFQEQHKEMDPLGLRKGPKSWGRGSFHREGQSCAKPSPPPQGATVRAFCSTPVGNCCSRPRPDATLTWLSWGASLSREEEEEPEAPRPVKGKAENKDSPRESVGGGTTLAGRGTGCFSAGTGPASWATLGDLIPRCRGADWSCQAPGVVTAGPACSQPGGGGLSPQTLSPCSWEMSRCLWQQTAASSNWPRIFRVLPRLPLALASPIRSPMVLRRESGLR